jgi:hypothetical protein
VGLTPFTGVCYSDECARADCTYGVTGAAERTFTRPRKIRALTKKESDVEALIVRMECAICHVDQDFVMTPANALKAGLKSV